MTGATSDPSSESPSLPGEESESSEARIERLVAQALERSEELANGAIESICRENPEHAAAIREQIAALRAVGLLGVPSGGTAARPPLSPVAPPPEDRTPAEPKSTEEFEPIGPYRPLKELGRGGQAVVYLAEDVRLHRPVALKILKGFGPVSEILLRRFRREAEVTSRLDHPGICPVYDAGMEKGIPYIAMRYVEGETLARKIERARRQTPQERRAQGASTSGPSLGTTTKAEVSRLLALLEKAARALHAAHEAGVVHRDVKPGNILVTPLGEPVLLDFGLAGGEDGELSSLTRSGDLFGTPAYMSLEQLSGKRMRIDRRTDVYSLGVTLYECLTLRRPFEAPTREALYRAIQDTDPPDPRRLNPSISSDLRVVLETALEKDRDRRYRTALHLAEDLRRVREREPIAAKPIGPVGRFVRRARRRPARAALLAALVLGVPLVAGLGGYILANLPEIEAQKRQALLDEVEGLLETGFVRLGEEDFARATPAFEEALRRDPESAEAIAGLSIGYLMEKRMEAVLDLLDRHRPTVLRVPDLERFRLTALKRLEREAEASELERRIAPPTSAVGYYFAGIAELQAGGDPETNGRARALILQAILTSGRARALYHFDLALAVGRENNPENASDVAASLTTLWPDSPIAWTRAAYAIEPTDFDRSIEFLHKAIGLDPDYADAYVNLSVVFFRNGLLDDSIAASRKALERDPTSAMATNRLSIALRDKGLLDEAEAAARKAIELKPGDPRWHTTLGTVLARKKEIDEAVAEFRRSIELDPTYGPAHLELGRTFHERGLLDDAVAACRGALPFRRFEAEARATIGAALYQKYDADGAIEELRKATELDPKLVNAWTNLGNALALRGLREESIQSIRRAIELKPDDVAAHSCLGLSLAEVGLLEESEAEFRWVLERAPEGSDVHFNLAEILKQQGRFQEALEEIRKAEELGSWPLGTWSMPSPPSVGETRRELEAIVALEPGIAALLEGASLPEEPEDAVWLAKASGWKGHLDLAGRLWVRAFELDPALAEDLEKDHRYNAACSAARAGSASPTEGSDEAERSLWRERAREWLGAELEARRRTLVAEPARSAEIFPKLRWWKTDRDLAGVRDEPHLSLLPEPERRAWRDLWLTVEGLLTPSK